MSRTPKRPADDAVLRPGDRVRVAFDFARWVGRHPTAVMTVATITRTEDGVTILGLRWAPSATPGGPEVNPERAPDPQGTERSVPRAGESSHCRRDHRTRRGAHSSDGSP